MYSWKTGSEWICVFFSQFCSDLTGFEFELKFELKQPHFPHKKIIFFFRKFLYGSQLVQGYAFHMFFFTFRTRGLITNWSIQIFGTSGAFSLLDDLILGVVVRWYSSVLGCHWFSCVCVWGLLNECMHCIPPGPSNCPDWVVFSFSVAETCWNHQQNLGRMLTGSSLSSFW